MPTKLGSPKPGRTPVKRATNGIIRLVLVHDHEPVRHCLIALFEAADHTLRMVGEGATIENEGRRRRATLEALILHDMPVIRKVVWLDPGILPATL